MMSYERFVDVELGSVFSGEPLVEKYVVKIKSLIIKHDDCSDAGVVLETKDIPSKDLDVAQDFVSGVKQDINNNLGIVANPYLIYSVQSLDNMLHPCRSVYVKYGVVVPLDYRGRVPVMTPNKCTVVRYDASCTGLRETEWMSLGNTPKLKFQDVPDDIQLPNSWDGKPAKYAFIDSAFFFEETKFAREFRDEMLMQQALRRYVFYKKIEKTW
ncbi:MAG: hypothetical protein IKP24_04775 [Alphaproteobacteria bacterium]|nr:hypothetical protein [Alphaproteobacteria bacterium]